MHVWILCTYIVNHGTLRSLRLESIHKPHVLAMIRTAQVFSLHTELHYTHGIHIFSSLCMFGPATLSSCISFFDFFLELEYLIQQALLSCLCAVIVVTNVVATLKNVSCRLHRDIEKCN